MQPLTTPAVGVFEVKLEKDHHHGLGITIAGYTDPTGVYSYYQMLSRQVLLITGGSALHVLMIWTPIYKKSYDYVTIIFMLR